MSDWVEFKDGVLEPSPYTPDGKYLHASYVRLANASSQRRGEWIGELRKAIQMGEIKEAQRVLDTIPSTVG